MKVKTTCKEFAITITAPDGDVLVDYRGENYTFTADLAGLVQQGTALVTQLLKAEAFHETVEIKQDTCC